MLLLHPYTPGVREHEQQKCRAALDLLHSVNRVDILCPYGESLAWPTAITGYWGTQDLIICEHDIGITQEAYDGLCDCEYSHCAVAYKIHQPYVQTNHAPVYCAMVDYKFIQEGCEHADSVGFGLVKLRANVMGIPIPERLSWSNLDSKCSYAIRIQFGPWHIHWPEVPHYHEGHKPKWLFEGEHR